MKMVWNVVRSVADYVDSTEVSWNIMQVAYVGSAEDYV